jgi:ferredoxin
MGTLSIQGTTITVEVREGTLLTDALKQAGITLEMPCGGKGTCGRCLVQIVSGSVDTGSLGLLSAEVIAEGFVLACKTRLKTDAITVSVPGHMAGTPAAGKFSDSKDDLCCFPAPLKFKIRLLPSICPLNRHRKVTGCLTLTGSGTLWPKPG